MSIDTRDKLIAALAACQRIDIYKATQTAEGAGLWHSLWKAAGRPTPGVNPPVYTAGAGYVPDNTTLGGLLQVDPGGANKLNLLQWALSGGTIGKVILYDRLWHCSGLTTAAIATLTITTPGALTRYTDGIGVEPWSEVYTPCGATGANWTLTYIDDTDTSRTVVYAHPANAESAGQLMPFGLNVASKGVKQPVSVAYSASSGTAGDIGITLINRLAEFPIQIINMGDVLDAFFLGMPEIKTDACLGLMVLCSTTNTGLLQGLITLGEG